MIVISDSRPLIALSIVSHLHIFKLLFGKIYISESVFQETVLQPCSFSADRKLRGGVQK